jgi:hypothetical protein
VVVADLAERSILLNDHIELIVQRATVQEEAIGLAVCSDDDRVRRRGAGIDRTGDTGDLLTR